MGCCSNTNAKDIKKAKDALEAANAGSGDNQRGIMKKNLAPEGTKLTPLKKGIKRLNELEDVEDLEQQFFAALMASNDELCAEILRYNQSMTKNEQERKSRKTFNGDQMEFDDFEEDVIRLVGVNHITMELYQYKGDPTIKTKYKSFQKTQNWNAALIMVASDLTESLENLLTAQGTPMALSFQMSLFSKPYDEDIERQRAWTQQKRIRRESFGLKLAVYNQNEATLRLLIDCADNPALWQVWNLGHIVETIRQIVKVDWINGLTTLLTCRRVKSLFASVNDEKNMLSLVNELAGLFLMPDSPASKDMRSELFASLSSPEYQDAAPYALLKIYLRLLAAGDHVSKDASVTLQNLKRAACPFFQAELEKMINLLDPDDIVGDAVYDRFDEVGKEAGSDKELTDLMMHFLFSLQDAVSSKSISKSTANQLIEDIKKLKPMAFKNFASMAGTKEKLQNVTAELLSTGSDKLTQFLFSEESGCNIKAALITEKAPGFEKMTKGVFRQTIRETVRATVKEFKHMNRYELQDGIPVQIDISYFEPLVLRQDKFMKLYEMLAISVLNLESVMALITLVAQHPDLDGESELRLEIIRRVLQSPRTTTLFDGSLNLDQVRFQASLEALLEDDEYFNQDYMNSIGKQSLKKVTQSPLFPPETLDPKMIKDVTAKTRDAIVKMQSLIKPDQEHLGPRKQLITIGQCDPALQEEFYDDLAPPGAELQLPAREESSVTSEDDDRQPDSFTMGEPLGKKSHDDKKLQKEILEGARANAERLKQANARESNNDESPMVGGTALNMGILTALQNPDYGEAEIPESNRVGPGAMAAAADTQQSGRQTVPLRATAKGGLDNVAPQAVELSDDDQPVSVHESDVGIHFDELRAVQLCSELSPAFEVTIESMIDGELGADELEEIKATNCNPFEPVQVLRDDERVHESAVFTVDRRGHIDKNDLLYPDRTLWSLFMFACYFDCRDAAMMWLESDEYAAPPIAMLRPPKSNQEHHVMTGASTPAFDKIMDKSPRELAVALSARPGSHLAAFFAIMNHNGKLLDAILRKYRQAHSCDTLREIAAYALDAALDEKNSWPEGLQILLRSQTTKLVFTCLRPEDRQALLGASLVDKLVSMRSSRQATAVLRYLVEELTAWPYAGYAALRYPEEFHKAGCLDEALTGISDEELLTFITGDGAHLDRLRDFADQYVAQRGRQHAAISGYIRRAEQLIAADQLIDPVDPIDYVRAIQEGNAQSFIALYEANKARVEGVTSDPYGRSAILPENGSQRQHLLAGLQLFRRVSYQIETIEEQKMQITWMPQDEALQHLLYEPSEEDDYDEEVDDGSEELLHKALNKAKTTVISTKAWNPLVFAIFYGRRRIVEYLVDQAEADGGPISYQHLQYLLCDIFRVVREVDEPRGTDGAGTLNESDDDEDDAAHLDARVSLLPLVLCLMTNQPAMFKLLWNIPSVWCQPAHAVLLANLVYETENSQMIQAFLTSEKTKTLFNWVSWAEKQTFIQFTIHQLEVLITDETDSAGNVVDARGPFQPAATGELAKHRADLERILNVDMLSQAPYSLVNLTENLVPLQLTSTVGDLIELSELYRSRPDGAEILELTLKNLSGESADMPGYAARWTMVNNNQAWSKKLYTLLEQLRIEEPDAFNEFRCFQLLHEQLSVFVESDEAEEDSSQD